jgi:S-DNA-T family DNA segregation ATPase FtsK/SpoIIIE
VIVDNADQLAGAPIDGPLREIARLVDRDGGLIACGANSTALAAQYHGLAVEVARHRTGVLFGPRATLDSDLFGLRLRAEPQAPPGRGYLIRRGQAVPFQAAFAGP